VEDMIALEKPHFLLLPHHTKFHFAEVATIGFVDNTCAEVVD